MRISENWLREWVNPSVDTQQLAHVLTMAGLEVDDVEPAAEKFSGVVIARVENVEPHPDAKKLHVCKVNCGGSKLTQVICGASNVRKGLTVAFAKEGAILPNNFKIEAKPIRGVDSFGMICSASELGLAESSQGIMELSDELNAGDEFCEVLQLDDTVIDIDLTPNRSDCLSVQGIAREVSALLGSKMLKSFSVAAVENTSDKTFPVKIIATSECPRYVGRVIEGVSGEIQSPLWMQEKLRRAGVRSINAIADITNFVMIEMGQPMHAFDLSKLNGGIEVRLPNNNEKLELLDGQTIDLQSDDLVIADEKSAVALAGVMGGMATSVENDTKAIFLESAFFTPEIIAGKARRYGLHTDSSHRFERGVDPELSLLAMERATQLILEFVGGNAGPIICEETSSKLVKKSEIILEHAKVESLLGIEIAIDEVENILKRLNCTVEQKNDCLHVLPPSFRFDLALDVDLIEEVARLVGYENFPAEAQSSTSNINTVTESSQLDLLRQVLVAQGYNEVISYSFVDAELEKSLNPQHLGKKLANPISNELAVMRSSVWSGLIKVAEHNLNRQQSRVRIFEYGLQFVQAENELKQIPTLSGLICGERNTEQWGIDRALVDFYDIKGDIEMLLEAASISSSRIKFEKLESGALHPGQSAEIVLDNSSVIGQIGKLHPSIQSSLDLSAEIFLFELNVDELSKINTEILFEPISKYPWIRRDITLIVDDSINANEICANIEQMKIPSLQKVNVFSVYKGKGVPDSKKSISLGLILQEFSRTLTDKEIEQIITTIISQLTDQVGAEIRN